MMKHPTAVTAMAVSTDGQRLFVGGDVDPETGWAVAQQFDTTSGKPIGGLYRDERPAGSGGVQRFTHLCLSIDGASVVSAHDSHGGVQLWDIAKGRITAALGQDCNLRCLAFSGDGSALHGVGISLERFQWSTRDWQLATRQILDEDQAADDGDLATHSIDAATYFDAARGLALATSDGLVSVWRAPFTNPVGGVQLEGMWVEALAPAPDGQSIVVAGQVAQPGGSWAIAWLNALEPDITHQKMDEDGIGPIVDLCFCGDLLITAHWSGGPHGTHRGRCLAWRGQQRVGDYDLEDQRPCCVVGCTSANAFWVGTLAGDILRFDPAP